MTDLNVTPYFDDFNAAKNYVRELFVPSRAVQARELTQLQSILQNQIQNHTSHFFQDGSSIINAAVSINFSQDWVEIGATDKNSVAVTITEQWVGRIFKGETSNATFKVHSVDIVNRKLFILPYGGTIQNENIDIDTTQDSESPTSVAATITASGKAIRANSEAGILYANGFFIQTEAQEHIVATSDLNDSYFVGYQFVDSFITEADDGSLVDPARGVSNSNAPGAHRLKVVMTLAAYKSTDSIPDDFYSFVTIDAGKITRTHNEVQYADIMNLLARRTSDESGDYTVSEFPISIEQDETEEDKVNVFLDAGNAYVQGFNHRTVSTTKLSIDKPRESAMTNNANLYCSYGTFFLVDSLAGGIIDVSKKEEVQLFSGADGTGTRIGDSNTIRAVGMYDINSATRLYLSGLNGLQSLLTSVRSIKAGTKIINVATRTIEADRLIGEVTEALYGISPNPAPIISLGHKKAKGVVLGEQNINTQKSFLNVTNKVGSDFVINLGDANIDFNATAPYMAIFETGVDNDVTSSATFSVSADFQTLTISGLGAYSSIDVISGIITKTNNQANPKTKTITNATHSFTASSETEQLPHIDIFQITSVTKDGNAVEIDTINLDNGQRDFYYDYGVLGNLENGEDYVVEYEYFAHTGTGDYFSVNSYMVAANTNTYADMYGKIGSYVSEDGLVEYELTDCLDFRRSVADIVSGTDLPMPESSIFVDYEYYLPRVDKIYLSKEGEFGIIKGIPSDFADEPNDLPNAMTLYTLTMAGYVSDVSEVVVRQEDNKRYTMRNIAELEKRIENLEYYTSLSLVENETNSLVILDENGNNKFKNGILVDSFQDHSIGDTSNELYLAAIDEQEKHLRPSFDVNSYDLVTQQEIYDGGSFSIAGISVNENTYTLAYTETPMIEQLKASETINVNPYNVFVWYGELKLTPSSDNWVDTTHKPAVTTTIDGNVDAFKRAANFMGTKWNSWQTNWVGTTSTSRVLDVSRGKTRVDRSNWRKGPHGTWLTKVTDVTTTKEVTTTRKAAQSRTGRRLRVGSRWVKKDLGSRVVDTQVIPYMRQKTITVNAEGLKPNTTLKALFDGVEVTDRCTGVAPATGLGVLTTDAAGKIQCTFNLPAGKFKTGTRDFVLIDDEITPETQAKNNYAATGILQTKEKQILSIEQPTISTETFSQSRVVTSTSTTTTKETTQERSRPYDPIAQSFFVDQEGGVFVNSIEVFFNTKDDNLPVSLEIVSNDNGYPSTFTLPFAKKVLYPADVNTSQDGSVPTKFEFSDPVYLEHLGDYSFVLKSNSNQYEVFIAKIGGKELITNKTISAQPYIGSLFKSQNAFTWNADQERDIKFKINRCSFDVNPANLFLQDNTGVGNTNLTSFMPNIDELAVEGTAIDMYYKIASSGTADYSTTGYTQINNKTNVDFYSQQTFNSTNAPFRIITGLTTTKENISPIIHRHRNAFIGVNNFSESDGEPKLNAGRYITKSTTIASPANDLKVLLDVKKAAGSDVELSYKVGEVLPKHINYNVSQEKIDAFEGTRLYVYHISTANVASLKGSFVSTSIDETNHKIFAKQITDIGIFIDKVDWAANGLEAVRGIIVTTEKELDGEDVSAFSGTYARIDANGASDKTFAIHSNKIWKSIVNNNTATPSATSYAWEEVPFFILESTIQDNVAQEWQPMVLETELDNSVDTTDFIEYTFKPKQSIKEEFTQYSIMINMRVTDAARVPLSKELRSIALS